jgi:hypothetical protein
MTDELGTGFKALSEEFLAKEFKFRVVFSVYRVPEPKNKIKHRSMTYLGSPWCKKLTLYRSMSSLCHPKRLFQDPK